MTQVLNLSDYHAPRTDKEGRWCITLGLHAGQEPTLRA
jgi:hypothetical protein